MDNEQQLEWFAHFTEFLYRSLGPGLDDVVEQAEAYANDRMGVE